MTDISILGVDAVAGDPDALLSVSAFLRTAAGEVGLVRAALERPAVECHWEGAAADAFRDLLADTPHDLTRAAASYELAATTMARYAASHRRARDAALVLAQRLAALVDQADGAHGSSRAARRALDAARRSASSDRTTQARERVDDALRSVAAAEDRAVALRAQIEAVQREAHENRRALDGVAAWAAEELRRASHLGLRNSLGSWARRHSGALRAAVDATGDVLGQAATLFKEACDLPGAVIELIEDPSWERLSHVLGDLSAALTVLGMALTVAATVLTGGALLAAIPEIMVGLKAATTASDVLKAGVDSYRRFGRHEAVSIVDLAADAATVGLSAHDLGTFQRQARGWIRGIHKPTAPAWKAWAAKVAVYGDGRPRSWQALRSARPSVAKDISEEALEAAAIELAADLVDDPQPATRRLTDLGRGLRSAAARMTHRVRVAPWPPTLETS